MPNHIREIEKIAQPATTMQELGLPPSPPDSIFSEILNEGRTVLDLKPNYLEEHSHPSGRIELGSPVDEEKSHGPWLYTVMGEIFYDASHSWMTAALDIEKHPQLNNADYLARLGRLAQDDKTPTEDKTRVQAAFVEMMQGFWPEADRILPVSAGGMAVDDAIEIALGQVAMKQNRRSQDLKIVTFEGAFGGRYDKGAQITGNKDKVGHKHTGIADHVTAPIIHYRKGGDVDQPKTDEIFSKSITEVEARLKQDDYACVVIEYPMQAEGGARLIDQRVLKQLHELCDQYGKVLVVDCVQMGGRAWTINDNFVSPFSGEVLENADILTFGKIFHANGTMVRDFTKLNRGFKKNWVDAEGAKRLGGTWTGHLSQMASGRAIMQTVMKEKLWENALRITKKFALAFQDFTKKYPNQLTNVRTRDLVGYLGLGFVDKTNRDEWIRRELEHEHVIFLPAGDDSIRLAVALDMNDPEADALISAMENQLIAIT